MAQLNDVKPLRVCKRCLMAIESHEGNQVTKTIYADEDNIDNSFCEWCGEHSEILFEIL